MTILLRFSGAIILLALLLPGCRKTFLDAKSNDSFVVPETLDDLQAILDNDQYMNGSNNHGPDPNLGIIGADDYYLSSTDYLTLDDYGKAAYTWDQKIPYPASDKNWLRPYRAVFYANTVLEGLEKINPDAGNKERYEALKGSALFYRAYNFYNLAQIFAPQFEKNTAASLPGIPLRLKADISEVSQRATLQETYARIQRDISDALTLLPDFPPAKTRPGRWAAFALLSRLHLTMKDYEKALQYSDSCLKLNSVLMDYNDISGGATSYLFPLFNDEVIFHAAISQHIPDILSASLYRVDSVLYSQYSDNDLRKTLFFRDGGSKGGQMFRGSYRGLSVLFSGLATDEVYLTKAETQARIGRTGEAMQTLNALLEKRYDRNSFIPFVAADADEALTLILLERRKELILRNLRWVDLRRLNDDSRFAKPLIRVIDGKQYVLEPSSAKYTWPIPDDVIGLTGMEQNQR